MLFNGEFRSIFGTCVVHSSKRGGCGHALVSLNIGSLDGQLSIEPATHSFPESFAYWVVYVSEDLTFNIQSKTVMNPSILELRLLIDFS